MLTFFERETIYERRKILKAMFNLRIKRLEEMKKLSEFGFTIKEMTNKKYLEIISIRNDLIALLCFSEWTTKEIARAFNISKARIYQIRNRHLRTLRHPSRIKEYEEKRKSIINYGVKPPYLSDFMFRDIINNSKYKKHKTIGTSKESEDHNYSEIMGESGPGTIFKNCLFKSNIT